MTSRMRRPRLVFLSMLVATVLVAACSEPNGTGADATAPDLQAAVVPGSPAFEQEMGAALAAQAAFGDELMGRAGVVGTAVGLSAVGRPVLMVLVEDASVSVPGLLGGVDVRPFVTGRIYALRQEVPRAPGGNGGGRGGGGGGDTSGSLDRTARQPRPVPIGVSTGHPAITAGTIGARVVRVRDGVENVYYALSNNHVYADVNTASVGEAVLQPGTYDGGTSPDDDIGTLSDYVPINFAGANNVIDAAIALTTTDDLGNATGGDGYGTPRAQTIEAAINMPVQKCGRTTDCTQGSVWALNATVTVDYGGGQVARFVNQIVVTPGSFSAGGDSGSLIVAGGRGKSKADDGRPVGLLFAGSASVTIANPIDAVLGAFGVTIDGS